MPNMTYCRFTNTLEYLKDCHNHMDDADLSQGEIDARRGLIWLCQTIIDDYGAELDPE